jgi:dsRNA-specific ribonuclease
LGGVDRKKASSANAISKLNERSTRLKLPMPSFVVRRAGPPHQPTFECTVTVADAKGKMQEFTAEGQGRSQDIKAEAAQKAIETLGA